MSSYTSFASLQHKLHSKYSEYNWFNGVNGYLFLRFHPIERRVLETLRYVELHPENINTFSYEFGSILRDIGSAFGSVLDEFVRNTASEIKKEYNIRDYLEFLVSEIKDIEEIGVELKTPFTSNLVLPFDDIGNADKQLVWWNAYNNVIHSDIKSYQDASLGNVILGITSLAILYVMIIRGRRPEGGLFWNIGYFKPIGQVKKFLFVKPALISRQDVK